MEEYRDPGDECPRRSCPSGSLCPSQAISFRGDGYVKGEDSHQDIPELPSIQEEALLGQSLLEPRILCEHHRSG